MLGWIIISLVWIIIATVLEIHCWYIRKHQKWKWNRRQEGLLSFSNKQFLLMRWLWPITLMVTALFVLFFYIHDKMNSED